MRATFRPLSAQCTAQLIPLAPAPITATSQSTVCAMSKVSPAAGSLAAESAEPADDAADEQPASPMSPAAPSSETPAPAMNPRRLISCATTSVFSSMMNPFPFVLLPWARPSAPPPSRRDGVGSGPGKKVRGYARGRYRPNHAKVHRKRESPTLGEDGRMRETGDGRREGTPAWLRTSPVGTVSVTGRRKMPVGRVRVTPRSARRPPPSCARGWRYSASV